MNDDIRQMLQNGAPQKRRSPINPRMRTVPRVHGGPPLDGGPQLGLRLPTAPPPEPKPEPVAEPTRTITRPSPEVILAKDSPQLAQGPHSAVAQTATAAPSAHSAMPKTAPAKGVTPITEQTPLTNAAAPHAHLAAVNLHKSYRRSAVEVQVLRGVDLEIQPGEFTAIVGQSGSGKSTLLHLLGTLDSPDQGEIRFEGKRIDDIPAIDRDAFRNKKVGMIFQFYHLLPELTMLENVLSPLMIADGFFRYLRNRHRYRDDATRLLESLGLGHRLEHKPRELSGGEMQRSAIARALITRPELLLADEPTGNLDQGSGEEILKILRTLNERQNLTIVMVTHDMSLAKKADRIIRLVNGTVAAS